MPTVTDYRRGQSRFIELVAPVSAVRLAEALTEWLEQAHRAAGELQESRRRHWRADWSNTHSFGTDRYHYLVGTADSVAEEFDELEADHRHRSLFLVTPHSLIYQLRAKGGSPDGPLLQDGDVQQALAMPAVDPEEPAPGLFSPRFALTGGREVLFLLWTGSETGLGTAWVGQGARNAREGIDWTWVHPLRDVIDSTVRETTATPELLELELGLPSLNLAPRKSPHRRIAAGEGGTTAPIVRPTAG
ncbi:hypothetical protein [Actinoalloteichus hymeniacidonis]|uniref:Uncharacterized protein n=1 Tax=Actinoalloteichus hymeniacidonis TaxID=340345 RepID=A0AAC9HLD0_9PSEU|nr:hypothetical protein [Actinoalloteichus hymeniacidonis]AOS61286.1 hypothetical protein TL08_02240 [Actinoalloteichus hymeniacidonis]MBB5910710.1 hypothetical protein [Actinoalloteichus hymeniacidonis]